MGRKEIEQTIISGVNKLDPSGTNGDIYKALFKRMDEKQFKIWVGKIGTEFHISLVIPIGMSEIRLSLSKLKKVATEMGVKLYEQVIMEESGIKVKTPNKFNIIRTTIRRSNQHATSKINLSKNNKSRNSLTGQVTGASKGISISQPEVIILGGYDVDEMLREMSSVRGGNVDASIAFEALMVNNGITSLKELDGIATKTQGYKSLRNFFKAMHLDLISKK